MELIKIVVTKEDIDKSSRKSCYDCAIAYALMRDMKLSYRNCSVADTIRITGCYQNIELPKWLKRWVISYDKGEYVSPIDFYIIKRDMPASWLIIHKILDNK